VDAACDAVVHVAKRTPPDEKALAVMLDAYVKYRRIYPALRTIFPSAG
jgi:sugar (pentulose or hexulose) kinase